MLAVVDAGPLYAAADASDQHHSRCLAVFERANLHFLLAAFAVAEASYLLGRRAGPSAEAAFLRGLAGYDVEAPAPGTGPGPQSSSSSTRTSRSAVPTRRSSPWRSASTRRWSSPWIVATSAPSARAIGPHWSCFRTSALNGLEGRSTRPLARDAVGHGLPVRLVDAE